MGFIVIGANVRTNRQFFLAEWIGRRCDTNDLRTGSGGMWMEEHTTNTTLERWPLTSLNKFGWLYLEVSISLLPTDSGVDGSFSVLSFIGSEQKLRVVPPIPQQQVVRLAPTARILLTWSDDRIKIWRIEEINQPEFYADDRIEKRYLLEMELNVRLLYTQC